MAKRASIMDGELFFLKQLLILREQIVPFDAEFSVVEKDLDFTHMRDYLRRILAGMPQLAWDLIDMWSLCKASYGSQIIYGWLIVRKLV